MKIFKRLSRRRFLFLNFWIIDQIEGFFQLNEIFKVDIYAI